MILAHFQDERLIVKLIESFVSDDDVPSSGNPVTIPPQNIPNLKDLILTGPIGVEKVAYFFAAHSVTLLEGEVGTRANLDAGFVGSV